MMIGPEPMIMILWMFSNFGIKKLPCKLDLNLTYNLVHILSQVGRVIQELSHRKARFFVVAEIFSARRALFDALGCACYTESNSIMR